MIKPLLIFHVILESDLSNVRVKYVYNNAQCHIIAQ